MVLAARVLLLVLVPLLPLLLLLLQQQLELKVWIFVEWRVQKPVSREASA